MRFTSSFVAALPALAAAQNPIQEFKAQVQNVLGKIGSYVPNPGHYDPVAALEAKNGPMKLSTFTLENWKETLYEPVAADATVPEEWWVLISGGNKTCFGQCHGVEQAFHETAAQFALLEDAPHMGYLNCDDQPILCHAWSTSASNLFIFDMLPAPKHIDIYKKRLNMTSTTSDDLVALRTPGEKEKLRKFEGMFHPFEGRVAELGLSSAFGYLVWALGLVPNWAFMLILSFGSRWMMSGRMQDVGNRPRAGQAPRQPPQ